jgi:hypothetical protein
MTESATALDFSAYITERTRDFTGREWLFKAFDDWLADPDAPQAFLLTGNPGSGKTAIAARLVQFSTGLASPPEILDRLAPGFLSAAHFCWARDRRWISPHTFTESLALQLAARYPAFAQALAERSGDRQIHIEVRQRAASVSGEMAGVVIHKLEVGTMPAEDAFGKTVREPLEALLRQSPSERLVILVDALDEALLYTGAAGIVDLLAGMEHLPEGVRWILTGRREEAVENRFLDAAGLFLSADEHAQAGQADVRRYVIDRLDKDKRLAAQAAALTGEQHKAAVVGIVDGAEGNFLYATFLLEEVAQGQRSLGEAGGLPQGLDGLYYDSLSRVVKPAGTAWTTNYAPLLGVLSVAQASLTSAQLAAFAGLPDTLIWEGLGRLQQFLQEEAPAENDDTYEPAYRLYHQSVVDFLQKPLLVRNGRRLRNGYYLPAEPWHRRIADYYWDNHHANWSQLKDAYSLDNLATHLYNGRQHDRLQALISLAWMAARFEGSSYAYDGFIDDVMLAWQTAHKEAQRQIAAGGVPAALADCVRYALIRTSINSLSASYHPALVARALETGLWPPERALSVAGRVPDPKERVDMFAALLATGQLNEKQSAQAQEADLEAALAIEDEKSRARALAALAPQLTGEARTQALARGLEAALAIEDEEDRARMLVRLAPQLEGEAQTQALARALEAVLAIGDEKDRAQMLVRLAPQFEGELLAQGLEMALAIEDERSRVEALTALAPKLTGEVLARALEAALAIEDENDRVRMLVSLAPQLTGEVQTQALAHALEAALAIEFVGTRAMALAALAPRLEGELLARGLEAALAIEDEWARVEALAALAPRLDGEALARALRAALAIEDEEGRARMLVRLALQLEGELLAQALEAVLTIGYEGHRALTLVALAPQLEGELLAQGLEVALAIGDERSRVEALAALTPQLEGELLARALEAALAIEDEEDRARMLVRLVPQLEGEALAVLLPATPDPAAVLRSMRQAVAHHLLNNLAAAERQQVLLFCAQEKLFAPPLLDQDTLAVIAGYIVEVCEEWKWM